MKKLACVLALAGAFAAPAAQAWGPDGHRAVGAIADRLLKDTAVAKQLSQILLPGETLESVANWADCVKGTFCGPQTEEMVAYVATNPKHSEYHYTDLPFQVAHYHDGDVGTAPDDIVQTLKECIDVLRGRDDAAHNPHHFTKRQALILLVHMTGDIHQPLHVGAAYVSKDNRFVVPTSPAQLDHVSIFDSRGGNNFLVNNAALDAAAAAASIPPDPRPVRAGVPQALTRPFHSYWDGVAVNYAFRRSGAKTPEQFADLMLTRKWDFAANTGDAASWPYQWADDALVVAKQAFAGVTPGVAQQQTSRKGEVYTTWPLEVPADYPVPSSDLARTQLVKAGMHLAQVLQAIFPQS